MYVITYLYYATGDQETCGTVRIAKFEGSEKLFFESHFPNDIVFIKASAKY
jgi:hypothetical protein